MRIGLAGFCAIAIGLGATHAAWAADLPVTAPVYKASPVAPLHRWSGFYGGLNLGYGWHSGDPAEFSVNDITPINFGDATAPSRGTIGDVNGRGVFGGGQVGYNWQFSPNWLAGVEADLQISDVKDSLSDRFTNPNGTFPINGYADFHVKWFGSLRGRLGYVNNNWLLYATGGLAFGQIDYSLTAMEVGPGALFQTHLNGDATKAGFAIGAGAEYAINPNVTLKAEYQYIDLGSLDATAPVTLIGSGLPSGDTATLGTMHVRMHTARIGFNYRFGGP